MKRLGLVAGLAAFAATAVLAATRDGRTIPPAHTLAPAQRVAVGRRIDGIPCEPTEALLFHIHAHLTIVVGGAPRQVPAGIGIGTSCFMWLHTHAADGIIHTESPVERVYTLGDFFDVWGTPLGPRRVGDARGPVTAFVDGRRFGGDPRQIPLLPHAQIQLESAGRLSLPSGSSSPRACRRSGEPHLVRLTAPAASRPPHSRALAPLRPSR